MSIVTDALNRLQAERSHTVSPTGSESTSPVVSIFSRSPHKPIATAKPILRQGLQGLALIMVLAVIGIGAYLWGLTMVPNVPEMPSPPITDSMDPSVPPSTATEEETAQPDAVMVPTSDATVSPPSRPVEEPSVSAKRKAALNTSAVPRSPNTTPARQQPAEAPKVVNPVDARQLPAPPTPFSPVEKPAETEAISPERTNILPREPILSRPSQGVPSGRTVLERRLWVVKQLINRKRYGQAMTVLQPLFVDPPEQWEPWFWRGTAHLGLGQLAQAEDSFVEGLARDSTIPHLWVQRALVSQQRGHFGTAVESLRQAELLAPELPEVQLNLGYSLEVRGDVQLAIDHYQTFLALTEGHRGYQSARKKVFNRILQLGSYGRNP